MGTIASGSRSACAQALPTLGEIVYAVLVDIDTLSDYPPPVTKQLVQEYVSENYGWSVRFAYRFSG